MKKKIHLQSKFKKSYLKLEQIYMKEPLKKKIKGLIARGEFLKRISSSFKLKINLKNNSQIFSKMLKALYKSKLAKIL